MNLEIDSNVGDYRIVRFIGESDLGRLYQAHDESCGRAVALRIFKSTDRMQSKSMVKERVASLMFHKAQAIQALHHPNIVSVHDIGERQGMSYMAMEWVEKIAKR